MNPNATKCPLKWKTSTQPLPPVLPVLEQTDLKAGVTYIMAYDSAQNYIGHCTEEVARKYIYSGLVYKTKKAYRADRCRRNNKTYYSHWIVVHAATNEIALVLVERSFTPEALIRKGDKAAFAKLFLERVNNRQLIHAFDEYNLCTELKKQHDAELAEATVKINTKYNGLMHAHLKDIIDGQAILDNAPIPLDF